jgi:hypothetical protein
VRFKRTRSGRVEAQLDAVEVAVLARYVEDVGRLLTSDPGGGRREVDPLEELVGLSSGQVDRPDDPALQRLLPDAYRPDAFPSDLVDDREGAAAAAAAEFRRFTEGDLRVGKRANAETVVAMLADVEGGGRLQIDRDQADAWLGALNDLRLVLGVRLDVDEDALDVPLPDDDPRAQALHLYAWLGWVQESLLDCLEPRTS